MGGIRVPVIAITGGIASGKSAFTGRLARRLSAEVFDADASARELVENDPETRQRLLSGFGSQIVGDDGRVDRVRLRETVFGDATRRKLLEEILHPKIRAQWTGQARKARQKGDWFLVEIPLLFETGAESECDAVVVVACQRATQKARIVSQRGLPEEMAEKMIASQASLTSKVLKGNYMIWNDAPMARMEEQVELFAGYLGKRYG